MPVRSLDLEQLHVQTPTPIVSPLLFTELEFRTLIPKLADLTSVAERAGGEQTGTTPAAASRVPQYAAPQIVDDPAGLPAMLAELRAARLLAIQTEPELAGISFAAAPGRSWYLPLGHRAPEGEFDGATPPRNLPPISSDAMADVRALLTDPAVKKAGHDIKVAWVALAHAGIALGGVVYDSMVASFVLDPGNRSYRARRSRPRTSVRRGRRRPSSWARSDSFPTPPAEAARVSAAQAEMVLRLEEAFRSEIEEHHLTRLLDENRDSAHSSPPSIWKQRAYSSIALFWV
jgi:DNA polymerase-1